MWVQEGHEEGGSRSCEGGEPRGRQERRPAGWLAGPHTAPGNTTDPTLAARYVTCSSCRGIFFFPLGWVEEGGAGDGH